MLREGWDVKNIAVIVALRRLASQTLTEQILGRGLRLPFGQRTLVDAIDQVDLVAHDSYRQLLDQKDVLRQRLQLPPAATEVDEHGAAVDLGAPTPEPSQTSSNGPGSQVVPDPNQTTLFGLGDSEPSNQKDGSQPPALIFKEAADALKAKTPQPRSRVENAPQVIFPRAESRLTTAKFSLVDIADGDAEAAGARFIKEVPTFIYRDALTAKRNGSDVTITVAPQSNEEAQQALTGMNVVRIDMTEAIMRQPEVSAEKREKNAAKRLVTAFLKGAGVTSETTSATWGEQRKRQSVEGLRVLIRHAIGNRKQEPLTVLTKIELPLEPVLVDPNDPDAYNDPYQKNVSFQGWRRNIMPTASFDAKSTEWELAHLLDREDEILWWLRIYTNGQAYIPTEAGRYFPDFIALGADGTHWVIEGKSNSDSKDTDVLAKKFAAERWARLVRDEGDFGTWRYMFATEAHIKSPAVHGTVSTWPQTRSDARRHDKLTEQIRLKLSAVCPRASQFLGIETPLCLRVGSSVSPAQRVSEVRSELASLHCEMRLLMRRFRWERSAPTGHLVGHAIVTMGCRSRM